MKTPGIFILTVVADLSEDAIGQLVQTIIDPIDSRIRFKPFPRTHTYNAIINNRETAVCDWTLCLLSETLTDPKTQMNQIFLALKNSKKIIRARECHVPSFPI